jgi:cysteine synthase
MFDQFSKQVDEFGNSMLNALNQVQGFFGKELDVANPIKNSILEMVGNTPLIRLNHVASHIQGIDFFLKAEFQNPTGSIRDRSAVAMIADAEKQGRLIKGSTILIRGKGSSSISLAWAGRTKGYKVVCYLEKSEESYSTKLRHFGAEIIIVDTDPIKIIQEKTKNPEFWYPNDNANMSIPNHHFTRTGPEIFRDMKGKVDYLVTGGGTGGTVTGIGRFFRSQKSESDTKIILTGLQNSTFDQFFSNTNVSIDLPEIFDPKVVDQFIAVTRDEAVHCQSDLLIREGIPVGITTGMILCGAIRFAESLAKETDYLSEAGNEEKKNLVILCPDRE